MPFVDKIALVLVQVVLCVYIVSSTMKEDV